MKLPRFNARRVIAVLLVALVVGQGVWWRAEVADRYTPAMHITAVAHSNHAVGSLQVERLWQLRGQGESFGGYSAMLLLGGSMRLFSDRGWLLTFPRPDHGPVPDSAFSLRQLYPEGLPLRELLDIESATRDPATGQYWVGYESRHTIYRYAVDGTPQGFVEPDYTRGWYANGGIEAMVRLADGRFLVFHEGAHDAFLYPGDPVDLTQPQQLHLALPGDYAVTDAGELPDGRIVVLLRRVALHVPAFETRLALLDPAELRAGQPWPVHGLAQLEDLLPRDNWEALAVEPGVDAGAVTLWLASDDNRSAFQRSYLARLRFALPPRQES